jgi:hypothetical protein
VVTRRHAVIPPITLTYHYDTVWGRLQTDDICKISGESGIFRFGAIAVDNASGDLQFASFFELDKKSHAVLCFRAFDPARVLFPTKRALNKQRANRREK